MMMMLMMIVDKDVPSEVPMVRICPSLPRVPPQGTVVGDNASLDVLIFKSNNMSTLEHNDTGHITPTGIF